MPAQTDLNSSDRSKDYRQSKFEPDAMLRQTELNFYAQVGLWRALKPPVYTEEGMVPDSIGAHESEQCRRARASSYREAGDSSRLLDTKTRYRHRPTNIGAVTAATSRRFTQTLNFERHDSILELGSGQILHGLKIETLLANIRYHATKIETNAIEQYRKLPLMAQLEIDLLDAARQPAPNSKA